MTTLRKFHHHHNLTPSPETKANITVTSFKTTINNLKGKPDLLFKIKDAKQQK